jgi:hypothetical protein
LTYTTLPTYTANHIGYTVTVKSAGAANPVGDFVIANPGVYVLTWWYWLLNTGSGSGYIETWCTDVVTNTGSNATIDGVVVFSNLIFASGAIYQGGQNMMRILKPTTTNKTYYIRNSFAGGYSNTNTGNFLTYSYVRIA